MLTSNLYYVFIEKFLRVLNPFVVLKCNSFHNKTRILYTALADYFKLLDYLSLDTNELVHSTQAIYIPIPTHIKQTFFQPPKTALYETTHLA